MAPGCTEGGKKGTAWRRRKQHQRATARKLTWYVQLQQASYEHHTSGHKPQHDKERKRGNQPSHSERAFDQLSDEMVALAKEAHAASAVDGFLATGTIDAALHYCGQGSSEGAVPAELLEGQIGLPQFLSILSYKMVGPPSETSAQARVVRQALVDELAAAINLLEQHVLEREIFMELSASGNLSDQGKSITATLLSMSEATEEPDSCGESQLADTCQANLDAELLTRIVLITEDVTAMLAASREAGIQHENDGKRTDGAGKLGKVICTDASDDTVRVKVLCIGNVWYPRSCLTVVDDAVAAPRELLEAESDEEESEGDEG